MLIRYTLQANSSKPQVHFGDSSPWGASNVSFVRMRVGGIGPLGVAARVGFRHGKSPPSDPNTPTCPPLKIHIPLVGSAVCPDCCLQRGMRRTPNTLVLCMCSIWFGIKALASRFFHPKRLLKLGGGVGPAPTNVGGSGFLYSPGALGCPMGCS